AQGLPLGQLADDRRVRQEWSDLRRSGLIGAGAIIKHLLLERPNAFEISNEATGQTTVRLVGEAELAVRESKGGIMNSEQMTSIEAYMRKAGGSERVSRL
ncbi:unnamed protein product, partial [Polarella glacialis]